MRSPRELTFRLKQEITNLQLWLLPPKFAASVNLRMDSLPDPDLVAAKLSQTSYADELLRTADDICAHQFPVFNSTLNVTGTIDWRRDYPNQLSTPAKYFRLIPYLDQKRVGDHKNIWELSRHQHLVLLSQAYLLSKRSGFLDEIQTQLQSWLAQNPFQSSINWTSSLEVAFRAFSWIWIAHLVGDELAPDLRQKLLNSLHQHGLHIQNNLSHYFSPNTHLLGEAVVLHALGTLMPAFPRAPGWVKLGDKIVSEQLGRQVSADGGHFEKSTYYHVYALDMFLFHAIISKPSPEHLQRLHKMAVFLQSAMGPTRTLPFIGDDDGGRWFHPYGERNQFGRATLATCSVFLNKTDLAFDDQDLSPQSAWWLGNTAGLSQGDEQKSRFFPDTGLAVLQAGPNAVIYDVGSFGPGRAGHSHSDTLSIVASAGNNRILIDPGTFTYVGDQTWRDKFRGSSAHNTIRVDGLNQATPSGPFRWDAPPTVSALIWDLNEVSDTVSAECTYSNFVHRRWLRFHKPDLLFVLDRVDGPEGEHLIEQFWHLDSPEAAKHLFFGSAPEPNKCWHSFVFGEKHPTVCSVIKRATKLPAFFASAIAFYPNATCRVSESTVAAAFTFSDEHRNERFEFPWPLAPSESSLNSTMRG